MVAEVLDLASTVRACINLGVTFTVAPSSESEPGGSAGGSGGSSGGGPTGGTPPGTINNPDSLPIPKAGSSDVSPTSKGSFPIRGVDTVGTHGPDGPEGSDGPGTPQVDITLGLNGGATKDGGLTVVFLKGTGLKDDTSNQPVTNISIIQNNLLNGPLNLKDLLTPKPIVVVIPDNGDRPDCGASVIRTKADRSVAGCGDPDCSISQNKVEGAVERVAACGDTPWSMSTNQQVIIIINLSNAMLSALDDTIVLFVLKPKRKLVNVQDKDDSGRRNIASLEGLTPSQLSRLLADGELEVVPSQMLNKDERIIEFRADHLAPFTVVAVKAPAPTVTAPAWGASLPTLSPTLQWTSPTDAKWYQLQVTPFGGDGPGIDLVVGDPERVKSAQYQVQAPLMGEGNYVLLPGMTYNWRVRTAGTPTTPLETDWSPWAASYFTVPTASASTVSRVAPAAREVVSSLTPKLTWEDANRATFYYEVQMSKDPTFGAGGFRYWNLVHGGVTSSSYTVPDRYPLEPATTYYWRVRPRIQGDGTPVGWSSVWQFVTP